MSASRAALLSEAAGRLGAAGVADAARDARLLMRWAAGLEAGALAAVLGAPPGPAEAAAFAAAIGRREAREPVSHITGRRLFWGREFVVSAAVLDPRPETEALIGEALARGPVGRVLDLGTGSGCILVTLLAEWPGATGTGTDISPAALDVARRNAESHGVAGRADFAECNWLEGVAGGYDLVVSNPPYIADAEFAALAPEVRAWEPEGALCPGGDGLGAYRAIARTVAQVLVPRGRLMLEIGPTQSEAVGAILADAGLIVTGLIPDMDFRPRVIVART